MAYFMARHVKSKSALFRCLVSKKGRIVSDSGISMDVNPESYKHFLQIYAYLWHLNNYGVKVSQKDGTLSTGLFDKGNSFQVKSWRELENLLGLVYFSTKYGLELVSEGEPITQKFMRINDGIVELYDGSRFHLEGAEPGIIAETYFFRIHDFMDFGKGTMLDVGAAFGDTAIYFAKRGATVFAVEPVNYDFLLANVKLNPDISKRIRMIRAAIGNDGEMVFHYNTGAFDGGASAFNKGGSGTVTVKSYSISSLIKELGLKGVDYLKIDSKGGENLLTVEDLKLVNSFLKIEYSAKASSEVQNLLDLIKGAGFQANILLHSPEATGSMRYHATIYARRNR